MFELAWHNHWKVGGTSVCVEQRLRLYYGANAPAGMVFMLHLPDGCAFPPCETLMKKGCRKHPKITLFSGSEWFEGEFEREHDMADAMRSILMDVAQAIPGSKMCCTTFDMVIFNKLQLQRRMFKKQRHDAIDRLHQIMGIDSGASHTDVSVEWIQTFNEPEEHSDRVKELRACANDIMREPSRKFGVDCKVHRMARSLLWVAGYEVHIRYVQVRHMKGGGGRGRLVSKFTVSKRGKTRRYDNIPIGGSENEVEEDDVGADDQVGEEGSEHFGHFWGMVN